MSQNTQLLGQLVARKHECLRLLREMGQRQFEMIRAGTITELLDVLSAKQRVLGRLQKIERGLDPFRNQDAARRRWASEDDRRQCSEMLNECESLLAEIAGQEKQSEEELIRRRDQAAAQLTGMQRGLRARGAYVAQPQRGLSQLDLFSEA
jgi:hypothetical protein